VSTAIPVDLGNAPAFREPSQAKAFALVVLLHREGHFSWDEWVRTLAEEFSRSPQRADEDAELAYHRQFLTALEKIVAVHGMASPDAVQARKLAWTRAYLNTPHGHPVDLAAADTDEVKDSDDEDFKHVRQHGHELTPQCAPVAISPARKPPGSQGASPRGKRAGR
jgi:nitrile hydratase accessory protein